MFQLYYVKVLINTFYSIGHSLSWSLIAVSYFLPIGNWLVPIICHSVTELANQVSFHSLKELQWQHVLSCNTKLLLTTKDF